MVVAVLGLVREGCILSGGYPDPSFMTGVDQVDRLCEPVTIGALSLVLSPEHILGTFLGPWVDLVIGQPDLLQYILQSSEGI